MTVALAAAAGADTNAILASSADAMLQRAALYRQAAETAGGSFPWGTSAAAAGGLATGLLIGSKQSTGATTTQAVPAPGGAGAPTT